MSSSTFGTAPFGLGKTYYGESETIDVSSSYANVGGQHLEGRECGCADVAPSLLPANTRSADIRKTRIVRNTSGVTLQGGYGVTYSVPLKRVNGYLRTTAGRFAGITDPHLGTIGVRDGDLFHLVVDGQVTTKTPFAGSDFGGDWAVGDALYGLTSAAANATTTTQASIAGRGSKAPASFTAAQTTDGTALNYGRNTQMYAASAMTTGQTNANVLVYIRGDY